MKSTAYPTLDGLVDLACRDGVDVRPTLLRVVTDLYVQKPTHSTDETTRYVELALGLIESVDDATRAAVAASLAGYAAAPAAVLARLGRTAAAEVTPSAEVANATASTESDDLIELFFTATSEDRRLILFNLDAAAMSSVHLPSPLPSSRSLKPPPCSAIAGCSAGPWRARSASRSILPNGWRAILPASPLSLLPARSA